MSQLNYRLYDPKDYQKVLEYCEANGMIFPSKNFLIVVAEKEGVIMGIAGLKKEVFFTPLIADNSLVAFRLAHIVERLAKDLFELKSIQAVVEKESLEKLYNKFKYVKVHDKSIIMEKFFITEEEDGRGIKTEQDGGQP